MTNVYAVRAEGGPVKIGIAADVGRRLGEIHQYARHGVQGALSIEVIVPVPSGLTPRHVESRAHRIADTKRLAGEWFDLAPGEAEAIIRDAVAGKGSVKPLERKIVSMPDGLVESIKRYRFAKQINTEAEAIRMLIEKGLEAEGMPNGEE